MTPEERSAFIRALIAEHEEGILTKGYSFAVVWELRQAMYAYVSTWRFPK